ncbi:IclR family transcriptional regulator [Pannonibacter indicus]|uniref:Transcriptional regulator, IclR family n=1 Tax=Pannonibacter indicus TaxID=466044 RepID=A0A0K6I997_9HYPH|nr:IclR family transcriptional regulator [Pannonibacter indicus]CUA99710.1 transcriptional regulator, IclR family [Pannonibacter indicus]
MLNGSQSVDRALSLLSRVGRHAAAGAPLSVLVEESGLNKPTVRRLLLALIRAGLVEQDPVTRRYYPGAEAYVLGIMAARRFSLVEICLESLRRLSRRSEDTSFVSLRRGLFSVCLHREEGAYPVRTHALLAGQEHPLGVGAGSLAMLAALPDEEVAQVLAENAQILAERYPALPPERILERVEETRKHGFSLNPGLIFANSWGIGAALRHPDGQVIGALSIAAIDSRMQEPRQQELAGYLHEEVLRVEEKLAAMFACREQKAAARAISA